MPGAQACETIFSSSATSNFAPVEPGNKGPGSKPGFFKPPEGLILRQIQPNEERVVFMSNEGRKLQAGFEQKQQFLMVGDSEEAQVPEPQVQMCIPGSANWWSTVPMLVLQMDQGSPGCAGSA